MEQEDVRLIEALIEPLKNEMIGLRADVRQFFEKTITMNQELTKIITRFDEYKISHDYEHNIMWTKLREMVSEKENKRKNTTSWLDLILKLVAISGIILTVIKVLVSKGIL